jgi:hypothetical protein
MSASSPPPVGLPDRIWVVIRPSGERDLIHREPLGGIVAWAKGVDATIAEYRFAAIAHAAPPKKKTAAR